MTRLAKAKKKTVTKDGYAYYREQITLASGKRKSVYAKTQAELREKVKKIREAEELKQPRSTTTVEEYAAHQLSFAAKKVKKNTYVGYESKVRLHILPHIGQMRLCDVKPDHVRMVMAQCEELSASAYKDVHMWLRRIFSAAYANELIDRDPTLALPSGGGKPQKEKPPLTDAEVACLLATVRGLRVETFVLLAYYCGLRREEIMALHWEDVIIDSETPYLRVRHVWRTDKNRPILSDELKTKAANRDIPMPDPLTEHLKEWHKGSGLVYQNADGTAFSMTQFRHMWRQVSRRSTLPRTYTRYRDGEKTVHTVSPRLHEAAKNNPEVTYEMDFGVTPHRLRHTYITNLIHAGMDPKTVQYLAGHDDIDITMDTYAKVKYNRPEVLHGPVNEAFAKIKIVGQKNIG